MEQIEITPQILLERGFLQSEFNCYRFVRGRYLHELEMLYKGITWNELIIKN